MFALDLGGAKVRESTVPGPIQSRVGIGLKQTSRTE